MLHRKLAAVSGWMKPGLGAFRASMTLSPEEWLILAAGSTVLGESAGIGRSGWGLEG